MSRAWGPLWKALWRSALCAATLAAFAAAVTAPALGAPRQALPALAPAPRDALTSALETGRLSEAGYALERARSLFKLGKVRSEFGDVERPGPRAATPILRDLAVRLRFLSGAERAEAERILARPDDGDVDIGNGWSPGATQAPRRCGTPPLDFCIHWVTDTADAAAPAYVDDVEDALTTIWTEEIGTIGFRPPLSDDSSVNDGGGDELDVYLEDLGGFGVFGYCTSDDPNVNNPTVFAVSAYCVLDNDYAAVQFGMSQTPTEFLQVTAAHEFLHASQFAYDFLEDLWLMEGTATNMEETVYPDVDDNVNFLGASQLTRPGAPLDRGGFGDTEYGAWIWWRYLEEKVYGGNPAIIRRIWTRVDASVFAAYGDEYSLQATKHALRANGRSLSEEYSKFAAANRLRDYADGNLYPRAPAAESFWLSRNRPSTRTQTRRLNHLATRIVSFRPAGRAPKSGRLRVWAEVGRSSAQARLITKFANGRTWSQAIKRNSKFKGARTVPFGRRAVKRVDLVLTNGSTRTRNCYSDFFDPPFYSCFGVPRDDRAPFRFRARIR